MEQHVGITEGHDWPNKRGVANGKASITTIIWHTPAVQTRREVVGQEAGTRRGFLAKIGDAIGVTIEITGDSEGAKEKGRESNLGILAVSTTIEQAFLVFIIT